MEDNTINNNQLGYSKSLETNQTETPLSTPSEFVPESTINQESSSIEYASMGTRFVAFIIDFVVVLAINYLIATVLNLVLPSSVTQSDFDSIISSISTIVGIAYFVYFCTKGQTLGKKIMKIKIVDVSINTAPDFLSAVKRELLGKFLSSIFGLGYLTAIKNPEKQTWHDKIAKTVVVRV